MPYSHNSAGILPTRRDIDSLEMFYSTLEFNSTKETHLDCIIDGMVVHSIDSTGASIRNGEGPWNFARDGQIQSFHFRNHYFIFSVVQKSSDSILAITVPEIVNMNQQFFLLQVFIHLQNFHNTLLVER